MSVGFAVEVVVAVSCNYLFDVAVTCGVEVFAADGLFCCDADVVFECELVVCLCFFIRVEA